MVILLSLISPRPNHAKASAKPNIVYFLTDDQDQMLGGSFPEKNGGVGPMPQTKDLLAEGGATAENFFIHTPICNPSRSELLSGRYFHNIKTTGTSTWEMHVDEEFVNSVSFSRSLKQSGYKLGLFGKYMNVMPNSLPPGWDAWMANGGGTYVAPSFQMYGVTNLVPGLVPSGGYGCWGKKANHSSDPAYGCFKGVYENYSTSVIGNASVAWIRKTAREYPGEPFFAYIAPKAAHEPFNPAPWYEGYWEASWPSHEPRPENWNCTKSRRANHPGAVATEPMITQAAAEVITDVFKNRWRTLMSVDDVISAVFREIEELDLLESTYFFYSSDHGFQLGQFNIPMDKRHVYDWDTRIHLLARGPGIKPGSTWSQPATQVDLAPTFLGLAGISKPVGMDGKSLVPLLIENPGKHVERSDAVLENMQPLPVLHSTHSHLEALGDLQQYAESWRRSVFIEYYYVNENDKCMANCTTTVPSHQYPFADANCGDLTPGKNAVCWGGGGCNKNCYPTEFAGNNFIALRTMPSSTYGNMLYVEYQAGNQIANNINFTKVDFIELYNVTSDPWMLENLHQNEDIIPQPDIDHPTFHNELHKWFMCAGSECP